MRTPTPARPPNDPGQYDDLAGEWWAADGAFGMLHWLNAARGRLVPPPGRPGALLVDLACGGGLLAPHVAGYRHVGLDLVDSAVRVAAGHGVTAVRAEVARLPLCDACADVVVAGEILEHVTDLDAVVAEIGRVLRPLGRLVVDTIAATPLARVVATTVAERLPGGPRPGIHDPALFVRPDRLVAACARHGVALATWSLRPALGDYVRFLRDRHRPVRMVATRLPPVLYAGVGTRRP